MYVQGAAVNSVIFGRRSGGTLASPSAISSGDPITTWEGQAYDGASWINAGAVQVEAEGTIGTNRIPSRLTFFTSTDAAPSVVTERMRIDSAGRVGIGTTSPSQPLDVNGTAAVGTLVPHSGSLVLDSNGSSNSIQFKINGTEKVALTSSGVLVLDAGQLQFPATQNPSSDVNTLDDYEEGTWTPSLGGSVSESGQTYSYQQAKYTKIGRLVNAFCYLQFSARGTISGHWILKGLPFATGNSPPFTAA